MVVENDDDKEEMIVSGDAVLSKCIIESEKIYKERKQDDRTFTKDIYWWWNPKRRTRIPHE